MRILLASAFILNVFNFVIVAQVPVIPSLPGRPGPIRERTPGFRSGVETHYADLFAVGEVKGNVPNKAILLVKPQFPIDARWAGVEGEVRVQVAVDNEGNVGKAVAESGHPLLRSAAESAAQGTKFRIARDAQGQAIATVGTLIYTFEIRKASWSAVAFGLGGLKFLPAATFAFPAAKKSIPADWTTERELLEKLDEIRIAQPIPQPPVFVRSPSVVSSRRFPGGGAARSTMSGTILNMPQAPHPDQSRLASELTDALKTRLAGDELGTWQFEVGVVLRESYERYRNPYERGKAAGQVRAVTDKAPPSASVEVVKALRELEAAFSQPERTMETDNEISRQFAEILRYR